MDNSQKGKIKKRLTKNQILTVPNLLSLVRLLLIPVIVVLYVRYERYLLSAIVIVISGITDIADGIIARKFNLITDLGKVLDPLADKLTQLAMVFCVSMKAPYVFFLFGMLVLKDALLFLWGCLVLKKTDTVNSSRWYGKACTVVVYSSMFFIFLFPQMDKTLFALIFAICLVMVVFSTIMYGIFYLNILRRNKKSKTKPE